MAGRSPIALLFLVAATVVTVSTFGPGGLDVFVAVLVAVSLLPVIAFAVVQTRLRKRKLLRYVATALFLAFVTTAYVGAAVEVRSSTSSTAGLIYLFLPFYTLIAGALCLLLGWVVDVLWRRMRGHSWVSG